MVDSCFGSGCELRVVRPSPTLGSKCSVESAWGSILLPLPLPHALSQINKSGEKKNYHQWHKSVSGLSSKRPDNAQRKGAGAPKHYPGVKFPPQKIKLEPKPPPPQTYWKSHWLQKSKTGATVEGVRTNTGLSQEVWALPLMCSIT